MKNFLKLANTPTATQWNRIGIKEHHGIAIPLFSIHSRYSCGIGEYTDLPQLIDWCASIGFDIIQLLPLNDTGLETSPYSAISAFALDPIYIGIQTLPQIDEHPLLQEKLASFPKFSLETPINYSQVRQYKESFLRDYFHIFGSDIIQSKDFKQFIEETKDWLTGYAAFKILRARHLWHSWETWPQQERNPTPEWIESVCNKSSEEYHWFCFLQFICDQQLREAKKYGEKKNVRLMGDIPILIGRDSADVWLHQELFNLNFSAGAPPDFYSELGQNWGFPIYDWEAMKEQHYRWWIRRLRFAARHYDIYRIDHIVGFFRIWAIPLGLTGREGFFIPKEESTWIAHGREILEMMINASDMLPIGEDLGVIPPGVRECLTELGICGTKVVRWERDWRGEGEFIPFKDYPPISLTTVGTHDSETLQQWWQDYPNDVQSFVRFMGWHYHPELSQENLKDILWNSHHSGSLFHINPLQEYLALLPNLSSNNPSEERINTPGTISDRNWCYRLKPSLEELMKQDRLKTILQEILK